jgi:hypothetical protein
MVARLEFRVGAIPDIVKLVEEWENRAIAA